MGGQTVEEELRRDLKELLNYFGKGEGWPWLAVYNGEGQHFGITDEHLAHILTRINDHVRQADDKKKHTNTGPAL